MGKWPPGRSIGSTRRTSRAIRRDHSGRRTSSSAQTTETSSQSGHLSRGQGSRAWSTPGAGGGGTPSRRYPEGRPDRRTARRPSGSQVTEPPSPTWRGRALNSSVVVLGFGAHDFAEAEARSGNEGGQEHDSADGPRAAGRPRRDAAEGVTDHDHVVADVRQRIGNQSGVVHRCCGGVVAGEVDGHGSVATAFQLRDQRLPAPGSVPGPVDQREGGHAAAAGGSRGSGRQRVGRGTASQAGGRRRRAWWWRGPCGPGHGGGSGRRGWRRPPRGACRSRRSSPRG